jgi:hypothetical protein
MTERTPQYELEILRVSLARIAQACGPEIEREIPGAEGRTELEFTELSRLARELDRGWNRLAAFVVDHVENPSLDDIDAKLAEFP